MDEEISKSQKKRDAKNLQELGVALVALNEKTLNEMPLNEQLHKAIMDAKRFKSHGAKKRQELFIGKLLRASDAEAILEAYENIRLESASQTAEFHLAEQWRDRLLEDPGALSAFIDTWQPEDIQHFRQLLKKALHEHQTNRKAGGEKALFRYIRSCIK